MYRNNIAFKGICTIILLITIGFSQVSFTIENVDMEAGTLDIKMTHTMGCSYCSDPTFSDKLGCENFGNDMAGATWSFDSDMSLSECCTAYPEDEIGMCTDQGTNNDCPDGVCDAWFDGDIPSFQFFLKGITITAVSGGLAAQNLDWVEFDASSGMVVGISFGANVIPASSDVLTTISYSNPEDGICFVESDSSCVDDYDDDPDTPNTIEYNVDSCDGVWAINIISDINAEAVNTDWGECYCNGNLEDLGCGCGEGEPSGCDETCGSELVIDECGLCGGNGIPDGQCDCAGNVADCTGVCGGDAVVDECGECGGSGVDEDVDGVCDDTDVCPSTPSSETADATGCSDSQLSISQISAYMPEEFAISQNFPNPFNPFTSITFDVIEMDEITLIVYDLTGKEVATLVSGVYNPGRYQVEWNAVNNAGDGIVSGMYIYRYYNSEQAITRKMLFLK